MTHGHHAGRPVTRHHEPAAPSLRDYGRMLWRRRWIVLLVAVLAPLTAVALSLRQDPVYEASSQVLLQNENLAATLTGIGPTSLGNDPTRLVQTQADLARVPVVARRTLRAAHVRGMTARDLLANSSVSPKTDSDMLEFSVRDGNADIARKLATAYASQYTRYRREVDTAAISRALSEAEARLAELRKNGDRGSALYASVGDKVQTLQTMEALQTSNSFVVRTPDHADQVSPKPMRNGVLALALGLVLGVGLALLRETLDTRVRTAEEVSDTLGLPLLGRLPQPPKRVAAKDGLVTLMQPDSHDAEAVRRLRTNLDFVNLDSHARTILVTSALEGEGKTTTAANLAVALAQAGRSVALVDLDLRRPALHRFFNIDRVTLGATDVALGRAALSDVLRPVPIEPAATRKEVLPTLGHRNGHANGRTYGRLAVLPAGQVPPDPAAFIETSVLDDVLAELRERVDVVLIDSPPVLAVGDPLALSTRVDGVLLVVRLTMMKRPTLRDLRDALAMSPARQLGFVLTAAQAEERYGASSTYYYYETAADGSLRDVARTS